MNGKSRDGPGPPPGCTPAPGTSRRRARGPSCGACCARAGRPSRCPRSARRCVRRTLRGGASVQRPCGPPGWRHRAAARPAVARAGPAHRAHAGSSGSSTRFPGSWQRTCLALATVDGLDSNTTARVTILESVSSPRQAHSCRLDPCRPPCMRPGRAFRRKIDSLTVDSMTIAVWSSIFAKIIILRTIYFVPKIRIE